MFAGDVDDVQDEQTGGDSSKSNSVTSEHSVHSVGVSASSQSSSTNSLPAGKFFTFFFLCKKNINRGVPQGSLLGLFLYLLYRVIHVLMHKI